MISYSDGQPASYLHIHMIMNFVSFVDGKMYADNKDDTHWFLDHIKKVTGDYHWKIVYDGQLHSVLTAERN